MQAKSDARLLREYAERGSEAAFGELVTRHSDLVYSAALRQVGSSDLARRGVTTTAAALSTAISVNAVQVAPAGLAATLTSASLAGAAAGSAITVTVFKAIAMAKIKAGIIGAIAVAGVVTLSVVQHQGQVRLREENNWLKAEKERLSYLATQAQIPPALSTDQLGELWELRGTVESLRRQTNEMASLREQNEVLAKLLNWKAPGEFVPTEQWTDAGASTPTDALRTFFWAANQEQDDRLEQLANLQAVRDRMSQVAGAPNLDPEGRIGRAHLQEHLRGFQINSQWLHSMDEATLEVVSTRGDGTTKMERPKFHRVGGEWQLDAMSVHWLVYSMVGKGEPTAGVAQP